MRKLWIALTCVSLLVLAQGGICLRYAPPDARPEIIGFAAFALFSIVAAGFALSRRLAAQEEQLQSSRASRNELEQKARENERRVEEEIKGRRAVEEELRAGERYLAIILNSIGDGVLVTNSTGRVLRMNPPAEQLTGWNMAEAVGKPVDEIFRVIDEETRLPLPVPVGAVIAENRAVEQLDQGILLPRSGGELPVSNTCTPIRDVNGFVLGTLLVFRDVTEARAAEKQIITQYREVVQHVATRTTELHESERRHSTLLANLQGMAFRADADRHWTMEFVSEGCRDLLGLEPADLADRRVRYIDLVHPDDQERVWNEVQSAISRRSSFTLEYRVKHANGQWRTVLMQGRGIFDMRSVVALEGYVTDITWRVNADRERALLENQVRSAQKMEAIGTLAGGVAHDFNNVLTAILGSAELMKMDLTPDHPSWELLEQIFLAGKRAREVVQQILTFSQRRESERTIVRLQALVKECIKLLRATIPAMVEISCQFDPECAPVLADPTQIHQVIMNLCTNAWQALPKNNGFIRVNLEMCEVDESITAKHPDLRPGPAVRLSICDNGSGMNKATLERIFEPFFTTKPVGEGSGLGLSVVHGIIKAHHGVITVESEPGKGTIFQIYLPPQAAEEEPAPMESEPICRGNNERILFLDDDELAGRATEKILTRFGYRVTWFKSPAEALAQFRDHSFEYDLMVSDLAMRGMSGDDLAAAVLRIRPNFPILITTGLIDPVMLKAARQNGVQNILLKPVSASTLAREIARALSGKGELAENDDEAQPA